MFELISGIIAIVVSLEAAKARSFSKEGIFLSLEVSFALLGVSNIVRGFLVLSALLAPHPIALVRPFSALGDIIQAFIGTLAYAILLWTQVKSTWSDATVLPQILFPLAIFSFNILNVLMLLALTVLILARFLKDRNANQALVALGFVLLACAHLSNILGYKESILLEVENVLRFAGYLSLLAMLMRVRRS